VRTSQLQHKYTSRGMDIPAADCFYQTLGWPTVELVLLFDVWLAGKLFSLFAIVAAHCHLPTRNLSIQIQFTCPRSKSHTGRLYPSETGRNSERACFSSEFFIFPFPLSIPKILLILILLLFHRLSQFRINSGSRII